MLCLALGPIAEAHTLKMPILPYRKKREAGVVGGHVYWVHDCAQAFLSDLIYKLVTIGFSNIIIIILLYEELPF